ncbi:MAG: sigma-54-dependent Fis family transcriptional regulator [Nitrospirae bacterium]|nr:sigma-54-dependent Fis family transcriptional regulator [Nitrospirota bacterium]MBI5739552.1 sigma-54-dependent Fis family transcriptional regulator [Nitrospirota bacterium]
MAIKILVAEDEEITLENVIDSLKDEGYDVSGTTDGAEALLRMEKSDFDILVTDIRMPGLSGMDLLEKTKEKYPQTDVIIITGFGSIGSAVEAMKKGAIDYITKPFDLDELTLRVRKIAEQKVLRKENQALKTYFGMDKRFTIIAKSDGMKKILNTIEGIRVSDFNLLLTGETGVGKSLIAKIIHFTSRRQDRPFLSLNCATLTEDLLASELFGHERGAFTGALTAKQGLVEIADNGTLFLDEIAELSPQLQAKLLKVVEDGEFYSVGGTKPKKVDVRFIAATNQNVKRLISEGKFREDLYYRLNIMEFLIPPLRERPEDIRPLSAYFLQKHLPRVKKKISGFTDEAFEILRNYSFPGNVRELENIIERAIILEPGGQITPQSLPRGLRVLDIETIDPDRIRTVDEIVKEYAEKVVKMLDGNKTRAAELLGISRTSLWKILKED